MNNDNINNNNNTNNSGLPEYTSPSVLKFETNTNIPKPFPTEDFQLVKDSNLRNIIESHGLTLSNMEREYFSSEFVQKYNLQDNLHGKFINGLLERELPYAETLSQFVYGLRNVDLELEINKISADLEKENLEYDKLVAEHELLVSLSPNISSCEREYFDKKLKPLVDNMNSCSSRISSKKRTMSRNKDEQEILAFSRKYPIVDLSFLGEKSEVVDIKLSYSHTDIALPIFAVYPFFSDGRFMIEIDCSNSSMSLKNSASNVTRIGYCDKGNGYSSSLTLKVASQNKDIFRSYQGTFDLTSKLEGLIPKDVKAKINVVKKDFGNEIYLITRANYATYTSSSEEIDNNVLVIGVKSDNAHFITSFKTQTIEEVLALEKDSSKLQSNLQLGLSSTQLNNS